MLAAILIAKKRDGGELSDDEIKFLITGFCQGDVADYQMSALAMAICCRGMTDRETASLTRAMWRSGQSLPLPETTQQTTAAAGRPRVDKHSTGGLGDKVSLILAPLLAACEVDVPMISGRGLGLTGGTLDKLEAIEGFQTQLDDHRAASILAEVGAFIVGASERIAPADRKLYALRDVTGTVESIALITASILSKKLSANLDALVMDVKTGGAAFMKTRDQATELARSLVRVGRQAGLPTTAILSDMDQPLGQAIGNAIEVNEAIQVLQGMPGEVRDLTLELAAELLPQVGITADRQAALQLLVQRLDSGHAMERFERMVAAQGGRLQGPLPLAPAHQIIATDSGVLVNYDCLAIAKAVVSMGGGRRQAGDPIDPAVGIRVHARIGDCVAAGSPLLTLHCHRHEHDKYAKLLADAVRLQSEPVARRPLILDRLDDAPQ